MSATRIWPSYPSSLVPLHPLPPPPKFCFFYVVVVSVPPPPQWIYKLHNNWKEHKCNSLFLSLHMEPPKFKEQDYLSFLLYLHNRVELYVKLYSYMPVYISQFSNIVNTWPIASQDSVSLGALTEHHRRNILLTLIRVRLRSMVRHVEQKWKQVTLDKNTTVTAVMGAQHSCFEPHGKYYQVRIPSSTFRLFLVLCNGFQWRNNSPYFIIQWRNNSPYC